MDCKERVRRCVDYREVDRVPAGLFGTAPSYEAGLADYVGASSVEDMYRRLKIDVWHCRSGLRYVGGTTRYRGERIEIPRALYTERNPNPPFGGLEDAEQVLAFPSVREDDFEDVGYSQELDEHQEFCVCGGINSAVFHNYLYMCGQEDALCYLKAAPEIAHAAIDKIVDYWVTYLAKLFKVAGGRIDMLENCNDFGTQRSLFISRDDFLEFFQKPLQRIYDAARGHGVMYMQHSCGAIRPLIGDFIDMGAQILNPIQVSADGMDMESVVRAYRGRVAFYGGMDTQYLLPRGPVQAIRGETVRVLSYFGNGGGLILSGSQGLMDDIPFAHAVAMLDPALRDG